MNIIAQEARKRQATVKLALRKGKSFAAAKYAVSLSSVKRWCKRYDPAVGWKSLREGSHKPLSPHPKQHTDEEEALIQKVFKEKYFRWGWQGVFDELVDNHGYKRTYHGMLHAAKRMRLTGEAEQKKPPRKHDRHFPALSKPGEKVQIDVKEAPYCCLKGDAKRDQKHLYQWTAIDECTRFRFVYGYDEHTAENTVDFFKRLQKAFPFPIQCVQTDNGTEFTYKFISETEQSPLDKLLDTLAIPHKLIPPRTPWHNGKVERSHRSDQRYFYNWENFGSVEELNEKLAVHLHWYNRRRMRTLGFQSPAQRLDTLLASVPDLCDASSLRSSASHKSA
ncbi:MAG: DDE-type integrase/transposase/recombinase [Oscillospiraceae bacterium]|nr:DDE-type integrase/transposase/recombinase [Oscillospiraceae bacterium]